MTMTSQNHACDNRRHPDLPQAQHRSFCSAHVRVEWHEEWSEAVDQAFQTLPYDPLMDPELVQTLWEDGQGRERQKIALLRNFEGKAVGVVPLRKRGKLSWQLLTQYVMPYARFFVLPEYTDAALEALGAEIDCDNVVFTQTPSNMRMLRPEESWIVFLPPTYEELLKRTKYGKKDRRHRRQTAGMELREDHFAALPEALAHWQEKWTAAGSHATAARKADLLLCFQTLAKQGRLKTFSLHDGEIVAAMGIGMIAGDTMYAITKVSRDEYRECHAGIRLTLAAMEWGCENGMAEYDMLRTSAEYKSQWSDPEMRGYRLIRRPYGSEALGCAMEGLKEFLRNRRRKDSRNAAL